MTLNFKLNDGGKKASKRSKQSNDCTVRAIAIAYNLSYDKAYDILADLGRKCGRGFAIQKHLRKGTFLGRSVEKLSFPAVKGESRMNVVRFVNEYTTGVYIIRVSKHVATVVDGCLNDTFNNYPFKCVYNAYKIL